MQTEKQLQKMVRAALCLALAFVLPFFTGNNPEIGSIFCLLHLPVLLAGFLCGGYWGLAVGFTSPLLRSLIVGMPPLFPTAVAMSFELATYGLLAGFLYAHLPKKKSFIYVSLLAAMLAGRVVWGGVNYILMGIQGKPFTFSAFLAGAFTGAIPGIILQIVLLPPLVILANRQRH